MYTNKDRQNTRARRSAINHVCMDSQRGRPPPRSGSPKSHPDRPDSLTMVLTPWKKFLYRGLSLLNWSSISLILMVSWAVVTRVASAAPAPSPATKPLACKTNAARR